MAQQDKRLNSRTQNVNLRVSLMSAFGMVSGASHPSNRYSTDHQREEAYNEHLLQGLRGGMRTTQLQAEVIYNLSILMNTTRLEAYTDLSAYKAVQRSILNFGMPDIANQTYTHRTFDEVSAHLKTVIQRYEPRLKNILITRAHESSNNNDATLSHGQHLCFVIRAILLCEPTDLPLELTAEFDKTTGRIGLKER